MGALIALGTVLGIIVAGGTIWTWIWPWIKRYRDERRAERLRAAFEKGKLEATLADFYTRITRLEESTEKVKSEHAVEVDTIKALNEFVHTLAHSNDLLMNSNELMRTDLSTLKVKVDAQGEQLSKVATGFLPTPAPKQSNG